ncbi:site-specific integrase [Enterococcus entomosocium]
MSRKGENIYKRKDGRWEGRYPKGRKLNGKIHYGYVYRSTYRECKEILIKKKFEYQVSTKDVTIYQGSVGDWFNEWLLQQQFFLRPSTISSYNYKINKYVIPDIGYLKLSKLSTNHLQKLIDKWQIQSLSISTIQTITRILRKSLKNAVEQGKLLANPSEQLEIPKKPKNIIRSLTQEEQKRLIRVSKSDKTGLAVILALYTGLRIGEISALRWEDINFSENTIKISHTFQRISSAGYDQHTHMHLGKVKSANSQRTIPIAETLLKLLKKAHRENHKEFVFQVCNHPMEPRLLTYHFHRIRKKAGLEAIHFHQLRHTFATRCLEAQGDIASISALLGHASTKMTLDIYTDTIYEQRIATIQKMNVLLK